MDVLTLMAGRELEIKVKSERKVLGAWTWALLARFLALVQGPTRAGGSLAALGLGAAPPHLGRGSWVTRESSTDTHPGAKAALGCKSSHPPGVPGHLRVPNAKFVCEPVLPT